MFTLPLDILIVDDTPANQRMLKKALEDWGHRTRLAENGKLAIEAVENQLPDLILMDVRMDVMDGLEATRLIRQHCGAKWVPIIFLSALNKIDDIELGLLAGGDDYLPKPVDLRLLKVKIGAMQRIAALQQANEEKATWIEEENRSASHLLERLAVEIYQPTDRLAKMLIPIGNASGDLPIALKTASGKLLIGLADAAGHGLAAAVTLVPFCKTLNQAAHEDMPLPQLATTVNRRLNELFPINRFIAALLVCYDPQSGEAEILNAGLPEACLVDRQARIHQLFQSNYPPLGLWSANEALLPPEKIRLQDGDMLMMCTDGLTEACNGTDEMFGHNGILEHLDWNDLSGGAPHMRTAIASHCDTQAPHDDISLLLLQHKAA